MLLDEHLAETVVILAHGAGSHMEHKTVERLAALVREAGGSVVRFNFLYRALGRGMPDRMPVLMETFRAVIGEVRKLEPTKLVIGGHSMGGRVASMVESEGKTADGLLLFGYPLHPPGQFEKLRDAHLPQIQVPTLQVNGTADEFCSTEIMERVRSTLSPDLWQMLLVDGADHSYHVKRSSGRTAHDVDEEILAALKTWLANL